MTKIRGRRGVTSDKKVVTRLVTDFVTRFSPPSPLFLNVLLISLPFLLQGNKNFQENKGWGALANFVPLSIRLPSETCQLRGRPYLHSFGQLQYSKLFPPNNPRWHATKFQFILKSFLCRYYVTKSRKAACHSQGTICIGYYPLKSLLNSYIVSP